MILNLLDQRNVGRSVQSRNLRHLVDLVQQQGFVFRRDRHDMVHRQIAQHAAFDLNLLGVGLPLPLGAGLQLDIGENAHQTEHFEGRLVEVTLENQRRRGLAVQTALLRLGLPLVGIAVAVETHRLAGLDHLFQHLVNGLLLLHAGFDLGVHLFAELRQLVGHRRVEHDHRFGAVVRRTHGAELEAVARKGERRSAVAVGVVEQQRRDVRDTAHLEDVLGVETDRVVALAGGQFVEYGRNLRAEEGRDDGRRRFVGAQTVGVRGAHDRRLQQAVELVDRGDGIHEEGDELQVLRSGLARSEQVHARVGAQRPVVVLARTVDALEGFFVQQDAEPVTAGDLVHHGHQQLVMVVGEVGLLVDRSQLELIGRHLVMTGFDRNAQFQAFVFEVFHECHHAGRDRTEIVVLQLLVLGRLVAHERTAREHQVGTHSPQAFVHKEILLFPAQIRHDPLHVLIEVAAHLRRSLVHGRDRTQQGHLVIERLARIGDEDGRDAERRIDDERRRRRVPRRIAAGLERIADATVGERRGVRLLLHEQLAGELLQHRTAAVGIGKGVVLLCRTARQGLEPVRVVVRAVLQRPLPHARRDAVGDLARQARAVFHRIDQRFVSRLVQVLAHGGAPEHLLAEIVRRTSFGGINLDGGVVYSRIDHLESE